MELRILSPQESGFIKEIKWNNEELKKEIAEKMEEYKTLVYTENTIKDAKSDRATLNKLVKAIEDERKRIKKLCMAPVEQFEAQVKEVVALINEPIRLIDSQIKEVEEQKRKQKRKEIEALFLEIGFQDFVTLEKIWDEKWLNASVSLAKIEEQMKSIMYQVGTEVVTIKNLPEFSFEALDVYKETLNMNKAIQEGQRLAEIQKRKVAYEEQQRQKELEKAKQQEEAAQVTTISEQTVEEPPKEAQTAAYSIQKSEEKLYTVEFRVETTKEKLALLKNFFQLNHITYGPISKKGE